MPLPVRSIARIASTCVQLVVIAMNGRASEDSAYPATTIGFRRGHRSESCPEATFRTLLTPSATPSITPSDTAPTPRTRER
jgi:hypothetical protein